MTVHLRPRRWDDRGGISVFFAVAIAAVIMIIGLGADGAGQLRAVSRAVNVASEAARAGGQAIDREQALLGGPKVIDPDAAQMAVDAYLHDAGATSWTMTVAPDRQHLTVTVQLTYQPIILGAFGFGPRTVTGTSTANLIAQ
jgi:hypothetical protein